MKRATLGALVLITFVSLTVRSAMASELEGLWMSSTPEGSPQTDFPAGTEAVYAVIAYSNFVSENVRLVVSDYHGKVVFRSYRTISGSGITSIRVSNGQQAFPNGPYVTTLYYGGQYLTQAVEWTVGGVDSPPTPTPFPEARLEMAPNTLAFQAPQGTAGPAEQWVLITNNTAIPSIWEATASASWLQIAPTTGSTPALIRVMPDSTGLPAGSYQSQIVATADNIAGSPQRVSVELDITAPQGTVTADVPSVTEGSGWVQSDEPDRNHFGEAEIRAGQRDNRTFLGALQFDTASLANVSHIRAAAVILTGQQWDTQPASGSWKLELIDSTLAEDWADRGYTEIANAIVQLPLQPAHQVQHLQPGQQNVWHVNPDDLETMTTLVQEHNTLVLRLSYIGPAEAEGLYVWKTPALLRVNYEPLPAASETATVEPTLTAPATATATVALPTPTPALTFTPTASATATVIIATITPTSRPSTATLVPSATATRTPPSATPTAILPTPTPGGPPPPPIPPGDETIVGISFAHLAGILALFSLSSGAIIGFLKDSMLL